jgi:hypothetical protein|tara:strand:+ start:2224 stop:2835 length:612 start_codon:yes stop_codon:yes gene_type:complete
MKKILKIIGIVFVLAFFISVIAHSHTQNSSSGSNTLIDGDMSTTNNNTYSAATAVDNSTTSNSTSNVQSAPPTASSAGLSSGIDTCSLSVSAGVQTFNFGITGGRTYTDENCEMRKNAKLLSDLGMKVAAISLVCSSKDVWVAMYQAGTYCPININGVSLIGDKALFIYTRYPKLRPDYEDYVARQTTIDQYKDSEIQYNTGR